MKFDFCVIGGGIVGLSTACALVDRFPGRSILLLEKEEKVAIHQTSHNSGVIHAGIYYKAGSLKARFCREGAIALHQFCTENEIPFETRGKLVVATRQEEVDRLPALQRNAAENQIDSRLLDAGELRSREPNIAGLAALLVPDSGIVDYSRVAEALAARFIAAGGAIETGARIHGLRETTDSVVISGAARNWEARQLVACAGLQSDRLARLAGLDPKGRIVPFRGEYYLLPRSRSDVVHHMIYPVPDPNLPFLGIHLTPTIGGDMTVGPNAVLGFAREGYKRRSFTPSDALEIIGHAGLWRLARKHWRSGLAEMANSLSRTRYLQECRRYCPSLNIDDLLPKEAGIRAQFVTDEGELFHDFLFLRTRRMLHVCNAPSPAATSSLPIGVYIADQLSRQQV
ncbi:L-2-hydroxyglutarate oxidase [Arvimicrobium flavum]|uniref:L-2-hydroxyglutarate oxidase n=1 Tax=Arvimicrobium flavum TaxID=3393320 RepID=UPI00237C219F|nr:L-2-hydroxyglutarate oxidase [Mesorhizobium shangrilense]